MKKVEITNLITTIYNSLQNPKLTLDRTISEFYKMFAINISIDIIYAVVIDQINDINSIVTSLANNHTVYFNNYKIINYGYDD